MDPVGKHPLPSSLPLSPSKRARGTLSGRPPPSVQGPVLQIKAPRSIALLRLNNGRICSCLFSTFRIFLLASSLCPPLPLFGEESWTPHLPLDETPAATAGYNPQARHLRPPRVPP